MGTCPYQTPSSLPINGALSDVIFMPASLKGATQSEVWNEMRIGFQGP